MPGKKSTKLKLLTHDRVVTVYFDLLQAKRLLFNPYYDADESEKSLISVRIAVPSGKLEDEPLWFFYPHAIPCLGLHKRLLAL